MSVYVVVSDIGVILVVYYMRYSNNITKKDFNKLHKIRE